LNILFRFQITVIIRFSEYLNIPICQTAFSSLKLKCRQAEVLWLKIIKDKISVDDE